MKLLTKKIWIIGSPGAGKTTIASKLSRRINVKLLELDNVYWSKNWIKNTNVVKEFINPFTEDSSWIIDGYYDDSADVMFDKANIIFWVQVPYLIMMWRLFRRSFFRLLKKQNVCGENYENIKFLFSKNGIFRFAHEQYFFFKNIIAERVDVICVKSYNEVIKYLGGNGG